jgi:hypothetical protein
VTCIGAVGAEMIFDLQIRSLKHKSGKDWRWKGSLGSHDISTSYTFRYARAESGEITNVYTDDAERTDMSM